MLQKSMDGLLVLMGNWLLPIDGDDVSADEAFARGEGSEVGGRPTAARVGMRSQRV